MIHPPSPDRLILRHLAARTKASATEIGTACRITAAKVRARPVMLESMRLVVGPQDLDSGRPGASASSPARGGRRRG